MCASEEQCFCAFLSLLLFADWEVMIANRMQIRINIWNQYLSPFSPPPCAPICDCDSLPVSLTFQFPHWSRLLVSSLCEMKWSHNYTPWQSPNVDNWISIIQPLGLSALRLDHVSLICQAINSWQNVLESLSSFFFCIRTLRLGCPVELATSERMVLRMKRFYEVLLMFTIKLHRMNPSILRHLSLSAALPIRRWQRRHEK